MAEWRLIVADRPSFGCFPRLKDILFHQKICGCAQNRPENLEGGGDECDTLEMRIRGVGSDVDLPLMGIGE